VYGGALWPSASTCDNNPLFASYDGKGGGESVDGGGGGVGRMVAIKLNCHLSADLCARLINAAFVRSARTLPISDYR